MIEVRGDIWDFLGQGWIVITTNGTVTKRHRAVMGRGVAKQAKQRFPGIDVVLGGFIEAGGNHVRAVSAGVISFPVKHRFEEKADLTLIRRSVRELRDFAASGYPGNHYYIVRPGCGSGGLEWRDVRPLLEPLDDRFIVVEKY